jgi:hypothetical protein
MQWKSSRFKWRKVHIFIFVIFQGQKLSLYFSLFIFFCINTIFVSSQKFLEGLIMTWWMKRERRDHEVPSTNAVCRLAEIKRASCKPGSASLLPWSMVTCPRWSWSLHCLGPSFICNTQEAAEDRNLRRHFELRSVGKDHVFFFSILISYRLFFFFYQITSFTVYVWKLLKALISA